MVSRMTVEEVEQCQGCWIEGSRGWTGGARVVEIAQAAGMNLDADDQLILSAYLSSIEQILLSTGESVNVFECVSGQGSLADKAEAWLNEHYAPPGYSFGWHDCEFFLWPDAEWEEALS